MKKYNMKLIALFLLVALISASLLGCFAEEADVAQTEITEQTVLTEEANASSESEDGLMLEISFSAEDMIGRHYTEAEATLRQLGFSNISLTADAQEPSDGHVLAIRFGGDTSFGSGDVYAAATPIEISYAEDRRIAVPCADVDCLNLHYTKVAELFRTAGFTDVQTEGTQVEYNENVKDGSVVVVAIGEETAFDATAMFAADAPVIIRYRIVKQHQTQTESETVKETEAPSGDESTLVWIPTNGGTKYHSDRGCSNMEDPVQVTLNEAQLMGFTSCARCH